jgi:prepilin-type N-terminal cleavage/methylation domain-containing protein
MRRRNAFTLVEVLATLAIIAVAATTVRYSLAGFEERRLAFDTERLATLITFARETSILEGHTLSVRIGAECRIEMPAPDGGWVADPDAPSMKLRPPLRLGRLEIDGAAPKEPRIVARPTGENAPFRLEIRSDERRRWLIGAADGSVRTEADRA